MIAALYVAKGGVYYGLPDVDPWDAARDARLYAGPWPVVAHPPCSRWSCLAGLVEARWGHRRGDDGGCFASALACVRRWGGVLEHPEASAAWRTFGMMTPPHDGGWVSAGILDGGWTCCVEQGHYGRRARKATWLYAFGVELPSLKWGPSAKRVRPHLAPCSADEYRRFMRPPPGISAEERARRRAFLKWYAFESGKEFSAAERMNKRERSATPLAFRDVLLSMARTARVRAA